MSPPNTAVIRPASQLAGRLRVPGDKSVSHRSLMLGALCDGSTEIRHLLDAEDVRSTAAAIRSLGVEVVLEGERARVQGRGPKALRAPEGPIDCGNSGTTMRLLAGLLAGQGLAARLTGDESLSRRPMRRVVLPLTAMGYHAETRGADGRPPLVVSGAARAGGPFVYESPVASAQVKSCVLLAGLGADAPVTVNEPAPSRDHTERLLRYLGYDVTSTPNYTAPDGQGASVTLQAPGADFVPAARPVEVPGDISSAAFWLVGAALTGSDRVRLEAVSVNPTRTGLLDALEAAGLTVKTDDLRCLAGGEPVADLRIIGSRGVRPFEIRGGLLPRLIDEIPVLAVLALAADGDSLIADAAELRVKESDRLAMTGALLRAAGAQFDALPDGLIIHGPHRPKAFEYDAQGDHRMAMAAAILALAADGPCTIHSADACAVSYESFFEDLALLTGEAQ